MKKSVLLMLFGLMTLTTVPANAMRETDPVTTTVLKEDEEKAKALLARLDEIKNIDKSTLTKEERKALRKEVRDLKSQLRSTGNGVYLSIGAIIIIILLLILLL